MTSLSQLWTQQGKKAEARQALAEIYAWFTEGFETADLKDAKALLDELSRQSCVVNAMSKISRFGREPMCGELKIFDTNQ